MWCTTRLSSFAIWIFVCGTVKSATDTDVRNLLTELFTTRSYDKLVRPIINQSEPVVAWVEYFLYGLNDVNEVEQKMTTTGYIEVYWKDEFLSWDPNLYDGLWNIYVPQGKVWKPDISLGNGFKDLKELGSDFIQVYITSDGYVLWKPFQIFQSKCNLDPTYFPFDKQTCNLEFVVWSLDIDDVMLLVGSDGINMMEAMESNGQWDVVSSSSSDETESFETKVIFSIRMKRKPLFIVMNIIIPIILLSILNIFTFQIPADCGERMGYTITVWLSFAVFLTIVSASLPKSSDTTPIISIFIMVQLGIGTATVLVSAVQSRFVSRSDDKPVTSWLQRLTLIGRSKVKPNAVKKMNIVEEKVNWKSGMAALDVLFFWLFFILLAITTFVILMISAFSNN